MSDHTNYKQFLKDQTRFDTGKWMAGPKITADDLKFARNGIQHISAREALGSDGGTMAFGKYRDKTLDWVKDNDEHYFEWCLENVNGFDKRAEKAGL